ncbi:hypothetical protein SAMN05518848_104235 [Paenibacillus sp. PDC88]|nr:hypothetical protein SAMN05518848_104235 [Paenibacillus sp. PDC88]
MFTLPFFHIEIARFETKGFSCSSNPLTLSFDSVTYSSLLSNKKR